MNYEKYIYKYRIKLLYICKKSKKINLLKK